MKQRPRHVQKILDRKICRQPILPWIQFQQAQRYQIRQESSAKSKVIRFAWPCYLMLKEVGKKSSFRGKEKTSVPKYIWTLSIYAKAEESFISSKTGCSVAVTTTTTLGWTTILHPFLHYGWLMLRTKQIPDPPDSYLEKRWSTKGKSTEFSQFSSSDHGIKLT